MNVVGISGSIHAFDSMNHFFFISQMIVPGSNYWNMGFCKDKGDVEKDEKGLGTLKVLGENMAYLLKNLTNDAADFIPDRVLPNPCPVKKFM